MRFLHWFGLHKSGVTRERPEQTKSKVPYDMTEKEAFKAMQKRTRENISGLFKKTVEKARKYGGDPFRGYREKRFLPEKFEYGMNCLLDRMAEMEGEGVVQKLYEEIRKDPNAYTIREDTNSVDVGGIPILFSLNAKGVVDAQDRALERIGKPQHDDKLRHEYAIRTLLRRMELYVQAQKLYKHMHPLEADEIVLIIQVLDEELLRVAQDMVVKAEHKEDEEEMYFVGFVWDSNAWLKKIHTERVDKETVLDFFPLFFLLIHTREVLNKLKGGKTNEEFEESLQNSILNYLQKRRQEQEHL